jgi:hypothetical protein
MDDTSECKKPLTRSGGHPMPEPVAVAIDFDDPAVVKKLVEEATISRRWSPKFGQCVKL